MADVVVWLNGYVNNLAIFTYLTTVNQSLTTCFVKKMYLKEKISIGSAKKTLQTFKIVEN